MCYPASFIATPSRIFYSIRNDSHSSILMENNILDRTFSDREKFAKIEISPPSHDYGLHFDQWNFKFDQDWTPQWANDIRDVIEKECRNLLPSWAIHHILPPHGKFTIQEGVSRIITKGSPEIIVRGGEVRICGSSFPSVTLEHGMIKIYHYCAPTIIQHAGFIEICDKASASITQLNGVIRVSSNGKCVIDQLSGSIICVDRSSPRIITRSGSIATGNHSRPKIEEIGNTYIPKSYLGDPIIGALVS